MTPIDVIAVKATTECTIGSPSTKQQATTAHTAFTGAWRRGFTRAHRRDPGTALSRENAYSVRDVLVQTALQQNRMHSSGTTMSTSAPSPLPKLLMCVVCVGVGTGQGFGTIWCNTQGEDGAAVATLHQDAQGGRCTWVVSPTGRRDGRNEGACPAQQRCPAANQRPGTSAVGVATAGRRQPTGVCVTHRASQACQAIVMMGLMLPRMLFGSCMYSQPRKVRCVLLGRNKISKIKRTKSARLSGMSGGDGVISLYM